MDELSGCGAPTAVAFELLIGESSSTSEVPRRLRQRLDEGKGGRASAEEINARLREADIRRQQFYERVSNKAQTKRRNSSWSSHDKNHVRRLEAKLCAAEQRRLSLLQRTQMRLARAHELQQVAKTGVRMQSELERKELSMKMKSRVQHAEANRMLLLKAYMKQRAIVKERKAQSLIRKVNRENEYKYLVQKAIHQKHVSAEKKRCALIEAERTRAHVKVMQAQTVAKFIVHQREIMRSRMKEKLEDRLQQAKRKREEYMRRKGSPSCSILMSKEQLRQGELLSRNLARCWRQFTKVRKTTFSLAKAYDSLKISQEHVKSLPFEQLACLFESSSTIEIVRTLLDRLESCLSCLLHSSSGPENIDHLLKDVFSPKRKRLIDKVRQAGVQTKAFDKGSPTYKCPPRYPVRIVLCAYVILGHPDSIFSGHGKHEFSLADSTANFIQEFELLIKIILDGPKNVSSHTHKQLTFRSQLMVFDAAWCIYLSHFVAWKVKDARLLEEDLVQAAHQIKLINENRSTDLGHRVRVIQNQSKYLRVKELRCSATTQDESVPSSASIPTCLSGSSIVTPTSNKELSIEAGEQSTNIVHSLFRGETSSPGNISSKNALHLPIDNHFTENEILVNEIIHLNCSLADGCVIDAKEERIIKAKIRQTMEKAFWDVVVESLTKEQPDYHYMIELVKEIRDELCAMSPGSWKEEIFSRIDLDILSQVLESNTTDYNYLGKILEYTLGTLLKLSAPANEAEIKRTHEKLLTELTDMAAQASGKLDSSFVAAVVRGLRFVLEQIQLLKTDISKARIQMLEPILRGPAGVEYLQKAFTIRYGPPSDAAAKLTRTAQWISSSKECLYEWEEHTDSFSLVSSQDHFPVTVLRSGGSISSGNYLMTQASFLSSQGEVKSECKGERIDVLMRLGLLKLVSQIDGLTPAVLPETMELNFLRLRNAQSQFQKIIGICISLLVLRQTLLSEDPAPTAAYLDSAVSASAKGLIELLEHETDVGIQEIIEVLIGSLPAKAEHQERKEMMARVLLKSLQAGDAVFTKVSRAIYLAVRGVVLGGTGAGGRKMAESALQRVGGAILLKQVLEMADVLMVMAVISGQVHRAWYERLV